MTTTAELSEPQPIPKAARSVSLVRLYLLRATYLLVVVGLALTHWPNIISHTLQWPLMNGVVASMLGAVSVLALLGLRYPLQMLPLLMFELAWKCIWLAAVALPLWQAGPIDAGTQETMVACLMGVIFIAVIPWPYVVANYVTKPSERWI